MRVITEDMQDSIPLALTSQQVQKMCNLSRSCLAKLVKEKQLTPLLHIKKSHRLFAMTEILELLKAPKK